MILGLLFACGAGYLAGKLMNFDNPWYINILIGLAGGIVGDLVFSIFGLSSSNIIGSIIVSVVGACIVIALYRAFKNKK